MKPALCTDKIFHIARIPGHTPEIKSCSGTLKIPCEIIVSPPRGNNWPELYNRLSALLECSLLSRELAVERSFSFFFFKITTAK